MRIKYAGNVWERIKANGQFTTSGQRERHVLPPVKPKVFIPKAILWTKRETKIINNDLQTQLNNELIKFLKGKV